MHRMFYFERYCTFICTKFQWRGDSRILLQTNLTNHHAIIQNTLLCIQIESHALAHCIWLTSFLTIRLVGISKCSSCKYFIRGWIYAKSCSSPLSRSINQNIWFKWSKSTTSWICIPGEKLQNIIQTFTILNIYSYVSNKRRATFILFEEIFQVLRSYSRPYVYLFLKKSLKIWVKIEKSGFFSNFFV